MVIEESKLAHTKQVTFGLLYKKSYSVLAVPLMIVGFVIWFATNPLYQMEKLILKEQSKLRIGSKVNEFFKNMKLEMIIKFVPDIIMTILTIVMFIDNFNLSIGFKNCALITYFIVIILLFMIVSTIIHYSFVNRDIEFTKNSQSTSNSKLMYSLLFETTGKIKYIWVVFIHLTHAVMLLLTANYDIFKANKLMKYLAFVSLTVYLEYVLVTINNDNRRIIINDNEICNFDNDKHKSSKYAELSNIECIKNWTKYKVYVFHLLCSCFTVFMYMLIPLIFYMNISIVNVKDRKKSWNHFFYFFEILAEIMVVIYIVYNVSAVNKWINTIISEDSFGAVNKLINVIIPKDGLLKLFLNLELSSVLLIFLLFRNCMNFFEPDSVIWKILLIAFIFNFVYDFLDNHETNYWFGCILLAALISDLYQMLKSKALIVTINTRYLIYFIYISINICYIYYNRYCDNKYKFEDIIGDLSCILLIIIFSIALLCIQIFYKPKIIN